MKRCSRVSNRREYEAYMASLWEAHAPRVRAHGHWRRHGPFDDLFGYELDRLARSWRVVRALDSGVDPGAFTDEFMRRTMQDTEQAVRRSSDVLREVDLLPLLDRQYDLMAEHLRVADLPPQEIPILAAHGFDINENDLIRVIYRVRHTAHPNSHREITPSRAFSQAQESLQEAQSIYAQNEADQRQHAVALAEAEGGQGRRPEPPERRKPRVFKGLGQLVQGAAMTLADVGLAVGAFPFPVSPETQSWGALASITAGVGSVMNGIGDLRGE